MFRKASIDDIDSISELYEQSHSEEEAGRTTTGWIRGIYPTRKTAEASVSNGDMYVAVSDGKLIAAAKINSVQEKEYAFAAWSVDAPSEEVMVLHTLVVSPDAKGKGIGTAFVKFYEETALKHGCRYLRMDTNERNLIARSLYKKLGYTEVSVIPTEFNGIPGVRLVCLEKTL